MINQILQTALTGSTKTSCRPSFHLLILQLMASISMISNITYGLMMPTFYFQSVCIFYLRSLTWIAQLIHYMRETGCETPVMCPRSEHAPHFPTSGITLSLQFLTPKTKESSMAAPWPSDAQIQLTSPSWDFSCQRTS